MNPAWIDNMSWEMAEVYGAVTDQILINLAKYFPYYNSVDELPRSAFTYQAQMLAQMGQVNRETVKIIRNGLKDADDALKGCLEAAIMESVRKSEPELYKAVKAGILSMPTTPVVSPNQMRAFNLYYKQASGKLNLVNTVMLESTGSAYRQAVTDVVSSIELADKMNRIQIALDLGAGETITGVSSWNQAVKHSVDKMKDGGITGFIDHGGHRWSAEAYTAMDIRTTVANTARAAVWETNQNFGNDLYLVSTHDGARPLCYPWQNKVISAMNIARDVVDLYGNTVHVYAQNETTYGMPAGLFGINCGHMADPFIPGVSTVNGQPQSPEENEKDYKESQEQRRLERKLREEKRDLAMAKAQGASDEEIKRLRDKCRNTSSDIDDFCDKTGRARHRDREAVYTQREFPEAKSYDVTKFETEQKVKIQEYYQTGGAQKQFTFGQMVPNVPIVPNTPAAPTETPTITQTEPGTTQQTEEPITQAQTFTPAKTIEEAEAFAKSTFVDENMWASQGVSLKGISVESANIINQRMSEFYNTYNVDKFSSLVAPAGNTKLGKKIQGAQAGFNPINRMMILNRNQLKNLGTITENLAKERELVADYLANPDKYAKLNGYVRKMLDNSRQSGRFSVAETLGEIIDHEDGHALEKAIRKLESYETIAANMAQYAPGISGYSQESINEYIAESFCAYNKGGIPIDPELVKAFEMLRR